jgi:peptide/nickel transport system substrate-binding protein
MKRCLTVATAILLAVLALPACAGQSSAPPGDLVYGTPFQPSRLNPISAPDVVSRSMIDLIFDGLVAANDQMDLRPGLATRHEVADGGRQWVFHLRRDVRWHDGRPFTAEDVRFTYETVINPATSPTVSKADYASIRSVEVLDDYTVRFNLARPDAAFLSRLTLGIAPRHLLEGQDLATTAFNSSPVGTGPFILEGWTKGEQIVLKRNPDYFGQPPSIERLTWRIVPDSSALAMQVGSGDVSAAPLFNPEDAERLTASRALVLHEALEGNTQISLQLGNPLLRDVRVRQALAHAIDTEAIIREILRGAAVPATSDIVPLSWAYTPDVPTYPYDPARARHLMAEAGWHPGPAGILMKDGEPFRITLMTDAGHKIREQVMLAVHQYWTDLGIEVKVGVQERNSFVLNRVLKGDFDAVLLQSAVQIDPDLSRRFHTRSMTSGQNFLGYSNPEVDRLLDDGLATLDQESRKRIYAEAQRLIAEDLPQISLYYPKALYAFDPRLSGVKASPLNLFWNAEKWEWRQR